MISENQQLKIKITYDSPPQTQCACKTVCREIAPRFTCCRLAEQPEICFRLKVSNARDGFFYFSFALLTLCIYALFWLYLALFSQICDLLCCALALDVALFRAHLYFSVAVAVVVHTPSRIHHHLPLHISDKIMKMMHFPSRLLALRFTSDSDFSRALMINRSVRKHAKTKQKKWNSENASGKNKIYHENDNSNKKIM